MDYLEDLSKVYNGGAKNGITQAKITICEFLMTKANIYTSIHQLALSIMNLQIDVPPLPPPPTKGDQNETNEETPC